MGAAVFVAIFFALFVAIVLLFPSVNYVGKAMESSAGQGARAPYG